MLVIIDSKVPPPNIIIWQNKATNTMLVFNIILKFYWSKKSVYFRIID